MDGIDPGRVGVLLGVDLPPERVAAAAVLTESYGFAELWSGEDYFCNGGMAWMAAALATTSKIPVGMGIVSALVRHPAVLAMELATLSRLHPGRIRAGIGLGHIPWVEQMGLRPSSPLRAVRDCVVAVDQLLAGETLTMEGEFFKARDISLANPPSLRVPLYIGAWRQKMLRLSGEVADGALLGTEVGGPAYVSWARSQMTAGSVAAQPTSPGGEVRAFVRLAVGADGVAVKRQARTDLAALLQSISQNPSAFEVYGIDEEIRHLLDRGGVTHLADKMPERWVDDLMIAGAPGECREKIARILDAGADYVILYPAALDETEAQISISAREVLGTVK